MTETRERRVLYVRPGAIGNTLAAAPALRAIRKAWSDAHIAVLTERPGEQTLLGCPYVDEFLIYEKNGGQKGLMGWLKTVIQLQKREFTHAILSKRFFRMSFLARMSGAPVRVGFKDFGHKLTISVPWIPDRHVIDTNLDLVEALGIEPAGRDLEIWPSDEDKKLAEKYIEEAGLSRHPLKVAIHAGGVSKSKVNWPAERYADLALELERRYDAKPIFVGSGQDQDMFGKIKSIAGDRFPAALSAGLNIRASAHLISKCRFFVGADSGPSHLAKAVGTPGVIYYGPDLEREISIKRWKPEGDLWMAAGPMPDGSHADVRTILLLVSELIGRMKESGRWG